MIQVSVVTGFLGSGKTTLIRRLLHDPAFGRTAVIVNEFGEIALDHELIANSDDSILTLATGCLCCAVQTDLARTLMDLLGRRMAGLAAYDRILIEASGLSDPAPMLQAMMTDSDVCATHRLVGVATVVDSVHGEQTLLEHPQARHQVVLADRLFISKTDLRPPTDALLHQLEIYNPGARRMMASQVDPFAMFSSVPVVGTPQRLGIGRRQRGHGDIETFTVIRERPLPALALTMLLQAIAEHCGSRVLRMKGLIAIEELPGRPAVIHGVRHVVSPPDFLARWPSRDESTRIVFIGKALPRYFVSRLMDAVEEEVRDANTHAQSAFGGPDA